MSDTKISHRFRREVILHLYKNLMPVPDPSTPLILGIHGPSGEGKTYQCERLIEQLGIEPVLVSGGELESVEAGEPARLVRDKYLKCARIRANGGRGFHPAVLIFNDIDAAIGNWGDMVQYTVNRQNIFGELMHLADFPHDVDGQRVRRVPIILTANDFTKLYGPLIRPGRMRSFPWVPSREEKAAVLASIFPELEGGHPALLEEFPGMPIAFFAAIRNDLADNLLWEHIAAIGPLEAMKRISDGLQPRIPRNVTLADIIATGHAIREASSHVNHLWSNPWHSPTPDPERRRPPSP
ncbi:AAA family ATPase [Thermoactinospora rubra]|uniref:AAA family ATPase n=1 Tax=Thermoactinospora rubra TaxID=1088767 RepID=UPI000A0FBC10|nr:AAA family ATPase [Thermoactinospora rubra]